MIKCFCLSTHFIPLHKMSINCNGWVFISALFECVCNMQFTHLYITLNIIQKKLHTAFVIQMHLCLSKKKQVWWIFYNFDVPVLSIHLQSNNRADEHATVDVLITITFSISSFSLPFRIISQIQLLYILERDYKNQIHRSTTPDNEIKNKFIQMKSANINKFKFNIVTIYLLWNSWENSIRTKLCYFIIPLCHGYVQQLQHLVSQQTYPEDIQWQHLCYRAWNVTQF